LVEKPISVHKADAERLIAAHTNPRQKFAAMLNQRTDPYYQKIRALVRGGKLGALWRIQWTITDWFRTEAYYAAGGWRATWRGEGGGVLLNQAMHNLDIWQWLFGLPARVRADCRFGRYHHIEVEDDVTAVFEYAHGASGVFVTSTGEAPGTNRLEVAGDRGRLVYENNRLNFVRNEVPAREFSRAATQSYTLPPHQRAEFTLPDHGGQHVAVLQNFVDTILDGGLLLAPAAEGVGAVELANAMLWSSLTGQPVELPLDSAGFAAQLQKLITTSRPVKPAGAKMTEEVRPYLVAGHQN
jgi:predicted dehydrogenase